MNFDRLAAHYHWMEVIFAGGLMHRCRTAHLARTKDCRHALLVGEGTGKFLAELLRANPEIQITCVEHSEGMIEQARECLRRERLDESRVHFKQMDALHWIPPAKKFDLVVTNFFLDCFRADQLQKLVPRLAGSASAEALWLLADFRLPGRGWRRARAVVILTVLYAFFKISTALSANWLTPPDKFLAAAGFKLVDRRLANFGFAHADCWRRTIS
ncbi:MAG TPA: class I SAM-dependent methyltransferase [Verrucomicrobiae bacterium]